MYSEELIRHMHKQKPSLDTDRKFIFFSNAKVLQKSILWNVLSERAIMKNNGFRNYYKFLMSHPIKELKDIFKFTIVRNPFDRFVSAFHFLQQTYPNIISPNENFKDFVKTRFSKDGITINKHFHHQYPNAFFGKEIFVDFIGRFENIENDWERIAQKINCSIDLPHDNMSIHEPYQNYYDDECIGIIEETYKYDLELLGYEYEPR